MAPPPAVAAPTDTAPADGAQLASATATAAADDAPEASAGVGGGGGAAGGDTLLCPALSSGEVSRRFRVRPVTAMMMRTKAS